jgi:hypothetical protein
MAICTVTGRICKADETPLAHQQVTATIKSTQADQGGQIAGTVGVVSDPIEAVTDDEGNFAIDLIQGSIVLLSIPTINLRKEVEIPAENTVVFTELI